MWPALDSSSKPVKRSHFDTPSECHQDDRTSSGCGSGSLSDFRKKGGCGAGYV